MHPTGKGSNFLSFLQLYLALMAEFCIISDLNLLFGRQNSNFEDSWFFSPVGICSWAYLLVKSDIHICLFTSYTVGPSVLNFWTQTAPILCRSCVKKSLAGAVGLGKASNSEKGTAPKRPH